MQKVMFILFSQLGRCRPVSDFEKLNRIGEGTYGIVCEYASMFIFSGVNTVVPIHFKCQMVTLFVGTIM